MNFTDFLGPIFTPLLPNKKMQRALEFQAWLLKELASTVDPVKDWRDQIGRILKESQGILQSYFVFTVFRPDDDRHTIEIFWSGTPMDDVRDAAAGLIERSFRGDAAFSEVQDINISHSVLSSLPIPDVPVDALELLTRTFTLKTPVIHGMIGLGLARGRKVNPTHNLLKESVLTSFIDIARSVLAITKYTREIERFATRDPLTGLYNQVAFWDLLEYETERSKRQQYLFSLLVLDIDNFKAINDTYGHEIGDMFLKDFSSILKTAIRKGDIPTRYGGDKFTAILPVCDEEQAYTVAKRIMDSLREFSITLPDGAHVRETASIGLAVYPTHATQSKDLYLLADNMLSQAKLSGKDRLSFPGEQDSVEVLRSMGGKSMLVMEALSQNRIVPYFQPIVNSKNMKIEAYEVLTRIVNGDRVIPAAEFIETAEAMGVIGRLDYQLLEKAFAKVREKNYPGTLFLNLSPKLLILSEFMPTVRRLLKDYDLDPTKMVFEITERDTVKNMKLLERFIHDMKLEGFRFAIDDFGAGYSSYQYIKTFKIDYLKVDGEFIRNMTGDRSVERAIVSSIVALAENIGIKTIAEFVETEDIMNQVESVGIDFAQGYYIQMPSPKIS